MEGENTYFLSFPENNNNNYYLTKVIKHYNLLGLQKSRLGLCREGGRRWLAEGEGPPRLATEETAHAGKMVVAARGEGPKRWRLAGRDGGVAAQREGRRRGGGAPGLATGGGRRVSCGAALCDGLAGERDRPLASLLDDGSTGGDQFVGDGSCGS